MISYTALILLVLTTCAILALLNVFQRMDSTPSRPILLTTVFTFWQSAGTAMYAMSRDDAIVNTGLLIAVVTTLVHGIVYLFQEDLIPKIAMPKITLPNITLPKLAIPKRAKTKSAKKKDPWQIEDL